MNFTTLLSATLILLGSTPAFADTLTVSCENLYFDVNLNFTATLTESLPEEHIELYTLSGLAEYTDRRGSSLEFNRIPISGTFDNSRGVTRISIRPKVPMMFEIFDNISITELQNKHQLFNISTDANNGPNFGTNGELCTIALLK